MISRQGPQISDGVQVASIWVAVGLLELGGSSADSCTRAQICGLRIVGCYCAGRDRQAEDSWEGGLVEKSWAAYMACFNALRPKVINLNHHVVPVESNANEDDRST